MSYAELKRIILVSSVAIIAAFGLSACGDDKAATPAAVEDAADEDSGYGSDSEDAKSEDEDEDEDEDEESEDDAVDEFKNKTEEESKKYMPE